MKSEELSQKRCKIAENIKYVRHTNIIFYLYFYEL